MSCAPALRIAVDAARRAGALFRAELHQPSGPRGRGDKAPADTEVELQIRSALLAATPYGYVGEETGEPLEGADPSHRWIVDPDDGTAAFLKGLRGASVSIALVRGDVPVLGVVYAYAHPDDDGDLIAWAEGAGPITRNGVAVERRLDDLTLDHGSIVIVSRRADDGLARRHARRSPRPRRSVGEAGEPGQRIADADRAARDLRRWRAGPRP